MSLAVSPAQSSVYTALGDFLTAILPSTCEVFQGLTNKVSEPSAQDFVLMIPLRNPRLQTNVDIYQDKAVIGSIADNVLTVTQVLAGMLQAKDQLFGIGVAPNTSIISGSVGRYIVTPAGQTVASTIIQAGTSSYLQATMNVFQLEVHGPNSADNAQIISTMFRDEYAITFFEAYPNISPCYADDPRQLAFLNGEQQIENRWIVEAYLQNNASVVAPQLFADKVKVVPVNVDEAYPPS